MHRINKYDTNYLLLPILNAIDGKSTANKNNVMATSGSQTQKR